MESGSSREASVPLRVVSRAARIVRWLLAGYALLLVALSAAERVVAPSEPLVLAALTLGVCAAVAQAVSARAERRDEGELRRVATALLVLDVAAVVVVLSIVGPDDSSTWALMLLPVLEGALLHGLLGGLRTWACSCTAYAGLWIWSVQIDGGTLEARSVIFRCAVVLAVAVVTGSLAELLARARAELAGQRLRDPLTGLANRALFRERLEHAWAHGSRDPGLVGILAVDCDDFRSVNDRHGHEAGDRALVEVARRLRQGVRPGDTVARMSGDEFMVLLDPIGDAVDASVAAARVVERLHALYADRAGTTPLSVSVGLAVGVPGSGSVEELMAQAEAALREAKRGGKDNWSRAPIPWRGTVCQPGQGIPGPG